MKKLICFILLVFLPTAVFAAAPPASVQSDIIVKGPWVDVRAFANLSTAKASSATAGKMILITNAQTVNNLTIPADREVAVLRDGSITTNTGKTLTFAPGSDFHAGDNHNCLLGSGTVTGLQTARPEWWTNNTVPGTTDMGPALQSAMDSGAHSVILGKFSYRTNQTLYPHGINIIGQSFLTSEITGPSLTDPLLSDNATHRISYMTISNVKLSGNTASATNNLIKIATRGMIHVTFDRVWFFSSGGDAIEIDGDFSLGHGGAYYNTFRQCIFGNTSDFSSGSDTTTIKGRGIYAHGSINANTIIDCTFWRIKGHGIYIKGDGGYPSEQWNINNSRFEACGYYQDTPTHGIYVGDLTYDINVSGGYFEGNGNWDTTYSSAGVFMDCPTNGYGNIDIKNALFASQPYAVRVVNGFGGIIDGNSLLWNGTSPPAGNKKYYVSIENSNNSISKFKVGLNFIHTSSYPYINNAVGGKLIADIASTTAGGLQLPTVGTFTPTLYGGATQITCSSALGAYQRIGNMLLVNYTFTVSNLNGATGSVIMYGADGSAGSFPSNAVPYPSTNSATLPPSVGAVVFHLVNIAAPYTVVSGIFNQTGALAYLFRKNGQNIASASLLATELAVGSSLTGNIMYIVN